MSPKTILSREGYIINKKKFKKEEIDQIKKELTVVPFLPCIFGNQKPEEFPVYKENKKFLSIPKYYGLNKLGKPKLIDENPGETVDLQFKGDLRDYQQEIVNIAMKDMNENDGGCISVGCGRGKTVMALHIACLLKVKTLVIVHKTFLLDQWKERAMQFTNAEIGIIQQNKIETEDKQIVIGMLQSIAKEKYESDVFSDFGLVIFDEAHHAPSKYFSKALPQIACKKSLALSATPKRSDRLEKILFWFMGPIIYKEKVKHNNNVIAKIYKYNLHHKKFSEAKMRYGKQVNRPRTINRLVDLKKRNTFILDILQEIMMEPERKVLVLSDRITHLENLKELFDKREITTTDFYIGGMSQKKLKIAENAQVLFASYGMASEALDIPALNTLVMVTPRREIEQSVGRIIRKKGKVQPTIIDIVDQLPSLNRQGLHRRKFYKSRGYQMKLIEVEDNEIIGEDDITDSKNIQLGTSYDVDDDINESVCFLD